MDLPLKSQVASRNKGYRQLGQNKCRASHRWAILPARIFDRSRNLAVPAAKARQRRVHAVPVKAGPAEIGQAWCGFQAWFSDWLSDRQAPEIG
ncbi:MAG TPA: hypothetical protein PLJ46_19750 [Burkholderiaceae bacterium]|nr:hypothetical protein [Rhodoferax sp.]HQZ08122.1 hypothetical protein [Burkholderiaceae bacterium]